jgi:acetylornithine aminotransferase/acetylornithine/N-succinyldiaminopimelate aminotransferase
MGALSATHSERYREPFGPLVPGFDFVGFDDVADLERKFSDEVAGIILEVIQGEGGVRPVSEAFYRKARELTRAGGAVLIADEIQCGMGRTGRWFAYQKFASTPEALPDLVTIAKPLGGGLPMGAVLLGANVAEPVEAGLHGTTFGGGPLACRLSLETIRIIEDEGLLDHATRTGTHFRLRLEQLKDLSVVRDVRGEGLMLAVELTVPGRPIVDRLLAAGFIANATAGTVLRFQPPLIIREKQIDKFIDALRTELKRI